MQPPQDEKENFDDLLLSVGIEWLWGDFDQTDEDEWIF